MSSASLYASCAEVLGLAQKQDLEKLLNPIEGFAPRLRSLCEEQISEWEESNALRAPSSEISNLKLEADTWGLLQAVMPARLTEIEPHQTAARALSADPYLTPAALAEVIFRSSRLLAELLAVREWLHDTAPAAPTPDATAGYWRFTKHGLTQAQRTGSANSGGLVSSMDPDSQTREKGRGLAPDDSNAEKLFIQSLNACIRAGNIDEAVELCRRAHQPWRAAQIRGTTYFRWPALSSDDADVESEEDDEEPWSGNRRRTVWKNTCTNAALNTSLPPWERQLYASLAPSPQVITVLRKGCHTWSDHLWAQISVICEERQEEEVLKAGGSFWRDGLSALDVIQDTSMQDEDEDDWEREALATLEQLQNINVDDGAPTDNAFHQSQLQIILDRIESLLESFAQGLADNIHDRNSEQYPGLTRFFAHLCLYLQLLDITVPPNAMHIILEAYLQVLEAAGQRDQIALYAGALGDAAAERYASFLVSLELSTNLEERRQALLRAKQHGLDVDRVGIITAERTISEAFKVLPPLVGELPSPGALTTPPNNNEILLLRSIEWTTFSENTRDVALEQANVILRYFLGVGRLSVAKKLLDILPSELSRIQEPENRVLEYMCYLQFFDLLKLLDKTTEYQEMDPKSLNTIAKNSWAAEYGTNVDKSYEQLVKLLTSDWLRIQTDDIETEERRLHDLTRIRQIYVPELIRRMHNILLKAHNNLPTPVNVRRTLELVNIVADARYSIDEDFSDDNGGKRLVEYLQSVRSAIMVGLQNGGSDPFAILAA